MLLIIAEIGTSHGGSAEKAKKLIDCAVSAGADAVKFQWVYADEILHPKTGLVILPTGSVSLFDRFRDLECEPSFYKEMLEYAHSKNVKFICSPFGEQSLGEPLSHAGISFVVQKCSERKRGSSRSRDIVVRGFAPFGHRGCP